MSLPFAGTGLATLYSYRQFRRHGSDSATAGWTLAVSGIFSTSSLALLLVAGAIAGGGGVGAAIGFAGAAVYLVPGAAVLLAVRYASVRAALSRLMVRAAHGVRRLPWREATRARLDNFPARLEGFLDRIASIRLPARGYAAVFGLALLNWTADCAALALAIVATGQPVPWHALLLAYGAGAAVGSTGLTPGGFGLVELAVAAALTAGGLSGPGALAAVLAYRIVNFWLVILTGWVIMLLLGDRPGAPANCQGPARPGRPASPSGHGGNRGPYGPAVSGADPPWHRSAGRVHSTDRTRGGGRTTDEELLTLGALEQDPHPLLAGLRERAPVAWVPALGGWLVTSYATAVAVMRDPRAFTVDDPRFSTARVVGPSMLSLDGAAHARHRAPFFSAFHRGGAAARLGRFAETEAERLVAAIRPDGAAELRGTVTGPLAVSVVAEALGLGTCRRTDPVRLRPDRRRRHRPVRRPERRVRRAAPDAAAAFAELAADLRAAIGPDNEGPESGEFCDGGRSSTAGQRPSGGGRRVTAQQERVTADGRTVLADAARSGDLTTAEVVSDAAVVMFGGIDTTDGMIANAILHLLSDPGQLELVRVDPRLVAAAIEESLRLEPAAALVDRYATRDVTIGGATVRAGDRVSVSLAAANRDPEVFRDPDRFDIFRANAGRHLAFAYGPHFCIGAALARAETRAAVSALLTLPRLRLDPARPTAPRGLIFRKPPALHVAWDH